jgi:uncharacterized protein YkwD
VLIAAIVLLSASATLFPARDPDGGSRAVGHAISTSGPADSHELPAGGPLLESLLDVVNQPSVAATPAPATPQAASVGTTPESTPSTGSPGTPPSTPSPTAKATTAAPSNAAPSAAPSGVAAAAPASAPAPGGSTASLLPPATLAFELPAAPAVSSGDLAGAVLAATNRDRARNGLPPLAWSGTLAGNAQNWANWMANNRSLTHQNVNSILNQTGFGTVGENILYGPSSYSADDMASIWYNSAPHRANILDPDFTHAGVGIAYASDGTVWAAMVFGG